MSEPTAFLDLNAVLAEWALGALDAEWAGLIRRALDDRPNPWERVNQGADPAVVARAISFVDYALTIA